MKSRTEMIRFNSFIISNFFIPTFLSFLSSRFWFYYSLSNKQILFYPYLIFLVPIFANLSYKIYLLEGNCWNHGVINNDTPKEKIEEYYNYSNNFLKKLYN